MYSIVSKHINELAQLSNQLSESAMYILMSKIYELQLAVSYYIIKPLKLFRKTSQKRVIITDFISDF